MYLLLFFFFFLLFIFFPSSFSLDVKSKDEMCHCQTPNAVKNRRASSKMFCCIVKNIFMSGCGQSDQSYHFAIFYSLFFF